MVQQDRTAIQSPYMAPPSPPPRFPDVTLAVLAGGRSERFGSDKALARLRGTALLVRVAGGLGRAFGETIVVADSADRYRGLPGVRVVADRMPGRGPLGGIHAALEEASRDRVIVTAVDAPLVDPALMDRLVATTADAGAFERGGFVHPLPSIYRRCAVLPIVRRIVAEAPANRGNRSSSRRDGDRRGPSPLDLFHRLGAGFVPLALRAPTSGSETDPLTDVDTPEDLAALVRSLGEPPSSPGTP